MNRLYQSTSASSCRRHSKFAWHSPVSGAPTPDPSDGVAALGTSLVVPLLTLIGLVITKRGNAPPPPAYDVRDLPDHPLLVSTKVHLGEPELELLKDASARSRRMYGKSIGLSTKSIM
jgi:hypothetical protein